MCGEEEETREESEARNIFKVDLKAVVAELERYDWVTLLNSNFQHDYEVFFEILEKIMLRHTPVRTPRKKKKNLYMTQEAVRLKNKKLRLWSRYMKTRSALDRKIIPSARTVSEH